MMFKAVVGCARHPEYSCTTIYVSIPHEENDNTMVLLDIGDMFQRDCKVTDFESQYPVPDKLLGLEVNVDEWAALDGYETALWLIGTGAGNQRLGVTTVQRITMEAGFMHGWDCPAADPKAYIRKQEQGGMQLV